MSITQKIASHNSGDLLLGQLMNLSSLLFSIVWLFWHAKQPSNSRPFDLQEADDEIVQNTQATTKNKIHCCFKTFVNSNSMTGEPGENAADDDWYDGSYPTGKKILRISHNSLLLSVTIY